MSKPWKKFMDSIKDPDDCWGLGIFIGGACSIMLGLIMLLLYITVEFSLGFSRNLALAFFCFLSTALSGLAVNLLGFAYWEMGLFGGKKDE